jgi:hypothetical protein
MDQVEVVPADQIVGGVAKLSVHRFALVHRDAVVPQQRDVVGRIRDQRRVQFRHLPLGCLVGLLGGDVDRDANQLRPTVWSLPDADDVAEPHHAAVGGDHPVFELVIFTPARGGQAACRAPVHIVGMRMTPPEVRLLEPGRGREAENALGLLADEQELEGLRFGFPDDSAERVDQRQQLVR